MGESLWSSWIIKDDVYDDNTLMLICLGSEYLTLYLANTALVLPLI